MKQQEREGFPGIQFTGRTHPVHVVISGDPDYWTRPAGPLRLQLPRPFPPMVVAGGFLGPQPARAAGTEKRRPGFGGQAVSRAAVSQAITSACAGMRPVQTTFPSITRPGVEMMS
jgi:hypothetical protein